MMSFSGMKIMWDGKIRDVVIVECDEKDQYQPCLYQFQDTGELVWIPADELEMV